MARVEGLVVKATIIILIICLFIACSMFVLQSMALVWAL
jgi:hypothetical protein